MHQFCEYRSIFTAGSSACDSDCEVAVVVNGSKQIIAGLLNEIMDGIHGDAVSGELGFGTFGDAIAWFSSLGFACFTRDEVASSACYLAHRQSIVRWCEALGIAVLVPRTTASRSNRASAHPDWNSCVAVV